MSETDRQYRNHVMLVADSPEQVRACDVGRLLDEMPNGIDPGAFFFWLAAQPGLANRTYAAIDEIRAEIARPAIA